MLLRNNFSKKIFAIAIILMAAAFLFNAIAEIHSLYYVYSWADIVVHFIAGISIYLLLKSIFLNVNIYKALLIVFGIALGWEIFELIQQNTNLHSNNFFTDTVSDIVSALIGTILADSWIKNRY